MACKLASCEDRPHQVNDVMAQVMVLMSQVIDLMAQVMVPMSQVIDIVAQVMALMIQAIDLMAQVMVLLIQVIDIIAQELHIVGLTTLFGLIQYVFYFTSAFLSDMFFIITVDSNVHHFKLKIKLLNF